MNQEIILVSIVISLIIYEMTGLTPGGIIVPYYFAIFLNQPERILTTAVISILTVVAIRILSKLVIIYGKRQFVSCVLISYTLGLLIGMYPVTDAYTMGSVIGILIPGILAHEMEKQGVAKTAITGAIATILIRMVMLF